MTQKLGDILKFIWRSSKRIVVFVVGVALLVLGVVMLVVPGPGLLVIIAGLAVLATEFAWAAMALEKAREHAAKAGSAAKQGIGRLRGRNQSPSEPADETEAQVPGGVTPPPST
jgi:uncharacterized protein (TIGR02611 family)